MAENRLIDANALLDAMRDEEFQTFVPLDEIDSVIDKAPTIDAVPVVQAKWEFVSGEYLKPHFRCSACSRPRYEHYAAQDFKFCPNCGAKMDGGATNGSDA